MLNDNDESTEQRRFYLRGYSSLPPPALLAILYAALIFIGSLLLMTPLAATEELLDFSEALFMATSAVTVTGLVLVEPGSHLTGFGQAVIAVLIQLGGLGLMTFAILILSSLGLTIGLPHKLCLQEDLNQTSIDHLLALVVVIMRVVVVAIGIGTIVLCFVFVPRFGWGTGLWYALFHSISAFNNAGFALFPHSLSDYATDPLVNITIPALFITGGLGFSVLSDIGRHHRWHAFSLHTKLMLSGSGVLIVTSVILICTLEWNNPATLGAWEAPIDKFMVGWFQAVTTRTAGFNTTDTASMTDASSLLMVLLMGIGGGSTSTAGGIKVTTFLILLLAIVAFFRRESELHAFGYRIDSDQILKVMALVTISLVIVTTSFFILLATQGINFRVLLFETVSAFGTVGLSEGATVQLDHFGRGIICFLMFIGRVGPLTLGFFLATSSSPRIRHPSSPVYMG